jgi:hypothetical protein
VPLERPPLSTSGRDGWLPRVSDPHRALPTDDAAQAGRHPDRESLTGGHRLLPAFRVEIGAAQGASRRVWGDALAAVWAEPGVHREKDAFRSCEATKRSLRSVEERPIGTPLRRRPEGLTAALPPVGLARLGRRNSVTRVLAVAAYNRAQAD